MTATAPHLCWGGIGMRVSVRVRLYKKGKLVREDRMAESRVATRIYLMQEIADRVVIDKPIIEGRDTRWPKKRTT